MNIHSRAIDLWNSLGEFDAAHYPSAQMGEMFNAVLAAAKEERPDDPLVQALTPATFHEVKKGDAIVRVTSVDAGTLRAAANQLSGLFPGEGQTSVVPWE
jgi:hypothetical protein